MRKQDFILNLNDPQKEKRLMWSTGIGFVSENSDDEQTKYLREERRFIREQQRRHGDEVYLKKRPMQPFEVMLLKMGGEIVLTDLCRKQIS